MSDSQPCGRIVVCTGDGIHATRADALDDAIAQPGGRRLRSLHDAPPMMWFAKIELLAGKPSLSSAGAKFCF